MAESIWGLLGPDILANLRRTRTLGLGASVRLFNDLAVPGLGGIWYGKQLLLATLGVAAAEQARNEGARVQNIETANAIEALACWLAFKSNGWNRDSRLRGNSKLPREGDLRFARVRQRNFYVTQPMRMAAVQALPALGFTEADGVRFNAFRCSGAGKEFIEQACKSYRPYNRSVTEHLSLWAHDQEDRVETGVLGDALSPLSPLSNDVLPLLRERLLQGGNTEDPHKKHRRSNALAWVEGIRILEPVELTWDTKPNVLANDHWHDLLAGAKFFRARDAAIEVLDTLETHIGNQANKKSHSLQLVPPEGLSPLLDALKTEAKAFLDTEHADHEAISFCRECASDDASKVLRSLVARDDRVLRMVGEEVKPGPAFRGTAVAESEVDDTADSPESGEVPLPENISYRMRNLYLLNLDMRGELGQWLNPAESGERQ